jgi:carboxymethylenebutenolidase
MAYGILAKTISLKGLNGDWIRAYFAYPLTDKQVGSVIVNHHAPGWDDATKEITRRFAYYGYAAICPHLYHREGPDLLPEDAAAKAREQGGVPDERYLGDAKGALEFLRAQPGSNKKAAVIGYCSGGRQAYLAACNLDIDAAVVCYGGMITGELPKEIPFKHMKPIIDQTKNIKCPILGLFGNDDMFPTPDQVNQIENELKAHSKDYEFYRYDGAGHAFFAVDRPSYRPEAANDGWNKIFDFFERNLKP